MKPRIDRSRRTLLLGACAALGACAGVPAAKALDIYTADVQPLSIQQGPRRGLVLDILEEACTGAGWKPNFVFLPFAQAMAETARRPEAFMAPLARTAQREAGYAWVAPIVDVPQAMGTLRTTGAATLDTARRLKSVGVVGAGVQEGYLREQGFTNLAARATARELATDLAAGRIDAWYGTATEIALHFETLGQSANLLIGPAIQQASVWLAANRQAPADAMSSLAKALERMRSSGRIEAHYRRYVPT